MCVYFNSSTSKQFLSSRFIPHKSPGATYIYYQTNWIVFDNICPYVHSWKY